VPRAELACCRVGDDGDLTAAQPSRAALRLLSGPAARAGRQLVHLHGMGNRSPRVIVGVFTPWDHATWFGLRLGRRRRLLIRMSSLSCEAETCRVRRRLIGGGPFSWELVGDAPN
jgi:hypothetical protein